MSSEWRHSYGHGMVVACTRWRRSTIEKRWCIRSTHRANLFLAFCRRPYFSFSTLTHTHARKFRTNIYYFEQIFFVCLLFRNHIAALNWPDGGTGDRAIASRSAAMRECGVCVRAAVDRAARIRDGLAAAARENAEHGGDDGQHQDQTGYGNGNGEATLRDAQCVSGVLQW